MSTEERPESLDPLRHERGMHQVELEMQTEELRQAQVELEAARDRYRNLYDFAPVGYLTLSTEGVICEANLTAAALLGEDRQSLMGRRFARFVSEPDSQRWLRQLWQLDQAGGPRRIDLALQPTVGAPLQVQVDALRVQESGAAPVLRITLADITERKRIEAELRISGAAFELHDGIMVTDARGVILRVNQACVEISGYSAAETIGQTPRLLHSDRQDSAFYQDMWSRLRSSGSWQGELWNRRKGGDHYPVRLSITAVRDEHGEVSHYVSSMTDISLRRSQEEEIAKLAFYDSLTGLPNRRLLLDRLQQALVASARTQREGALMFIDLDHFKTLNDTQGHDRGDELLRQVAQRLHGCLRQGDTVARTGGDEFVVMLAPELSDRSEEAGAQAQVTAEKILAALGSPYLLADGPYHGSASIGVTLFNGHQHSVDELLKQADLAMYHAKSGGRNTLRFFDTAIQRTLAERTTLEAELRLALQLGQFVVHYQPEVGLLGRLVGVEALVRWQHPHRGLLLPDEFIGLAEQTGVIVPLGLWVFERACEQQREWRHEPAIAELTVAVNVSARQLRDVDLVPRLRAALDRSSADAGRICLELTESLLLDNVDHAVRVMQALQTRGLRFALDDFGTGYASLASLKRLPFAQLKIDRSFVRDLLDERIDAAIAHTVLALGHNLGVTVVAEGVETRAQYDRLVRGGCAYFQGYLFGRAMPAGDLSAAARAWQSPIQPDALPH